MKKWTRITTAGLALGLAALALPNAAHADSQVSPVNDCDSTTFTGSHAGWGQNVPITYNGETRTAVRPDGWWEAHGNERWSFSITFPFPSGTWEWTDSEAGGTVQGSGALDLPESCMPEATTPVETTIEAATTLAAPVVATEPTVVVRPSVPLPGGVENVEPDASTTTTIDPYSTLPEGVTTSILPNGDVVYSDCVVIMACNDPMFDDPTTTVAPATTNGAPNNHTCDDAEPSCVYELPATGGPVETFVPYAAGFITIGAVAMWARRRPSNPTHRAT